MTGMLKMGEEAAALSASAEVPGPTTPLAPSSYAASRPSSPSYGAERVHTSEFM